MSKTNSRSARNGRATKPKFQPLPDLPDDEFEALKADIAENGLRYPVIQDEFGNTLDGHQRQKALRSLRIKNYPIQTISGLSGDEKRFYALSVNLKRRQLNQRQKRILIQQELKVAPERSNRWFADAIGVDHKTIQAVRKKLESTGEIPRLENLRGRDGRTRRYPSIQTERQGDAEKARQLLRELDGYAPKKSLTLKRASELQREKRFQDAARREITKPRSNARIKLYACDFAELPVKANSVRLVFAIHPTTKNLFRFGPGWLTSLRACWFVEGLLPPTPRSLIYRRSSTHFGAT